MLSAAVPSFWQVATQADFLKGEVENLSIDGHGRLMLGPASTPVYEATAPFLWTLLTTPDGATYVGSGNEGQVYRIDAAGKGTVFFDAEELEVHALAPAPGGGLFVGTSPDGKIYKVDAKGAATVFFDPPDKYIWSLLADSAGALYAATGDKGVVYKIAADGTGAPFYETKATHAIALAFDREGRLLVGSESPGRVFQVDATGKPFVLLDSPFNEIHAIRVAADGVIYAAALSGRTPGEERPPVRSAPEPPPPPSMPSVSTEITAIAIADVSVSATATPPRSAPGSGAGALYRILPDGASDQVWESREDAPYDVAFEADGSLLVATGNKGKIYRLAGDPLQATLITRAPAQQVTTVLRDRSGATLYATANPGKVFRLGADRAARGTYESEVRDAQTVATWGAIKWQAATPGGAKVEIFTRSGNTRTPDDTWSAWSAAYTNAEGSAISSPRARYLQWRAVVTASKAGESPLLTSVTAAYLQRNLRPRVSSITVHPPGTVFQKPFSTGELEIAGYDGDLPDRRLTQQPGSPNAAMGGTQAPALGRRAYQKGLMTFVWRADDENNDELQFDVLYRREGETTWKALKRALSDPIIVWDTTSVPNGSYVLRVVASDARANPPGNALTGHADSSSFDIDNAPPTITVTQVRREGNRTSIAFDVRDENSAVQKVEYSLDGDRWRPIYPKDGISDSRLEQFELTLDGDAASRGVVIRATDALHNVSSTRGEVTPARTKD